MIQLTTIEQSIINTMREFEASASGILKNNAPWTRGIKRRLYDLGCKYDYTICASGLDGDSEAEWLYDVVWYKEDGKGQDARLVDVPMIAECEWNAGIGHIKYDFEKLLLGNAPLRVMICQATTDTMQATKDYFADAIDKYPYNSRDARFLIIILETTSETFNYMLITNGENHELQTHLKQLHT